MSPPSAPAEDGPAPLPALDGHHDLAADAVDAFRRDGHVLVRGLADPDEAAAYREVVAPLAVEHAWDRRPLEQRDTYGRAFLQAFNLWEIDERLAGFSLSPRFAEVAATLLGVEGLRLYHDQALFKEPDGGHTPWHQDQYYWPFDRDLTVTMWMALVDLGADSGLVRFAAGSHRRGYLGHRHISDDSEAHYATLVEAEGFPVHETPPMRAGDATFHTGWTLHGAPPNRSGAMRAAMTTIWYADGLAMIEPDNPGRELDAAVWLPGVRPGEVAASPRNPLVWPPAATRSG